MINERLVNKYDKSHNWFKTIFEQSTLGNKIINKDLKIIKVNEALIQLLGYSEDELLGNKITSFAHPDFVEDWKAVQQSLWALKHLSFTIDTCLIKKDKTFLWCTVTSILLFDNVQTFGYSIIQDISDRKTFERSQILKTAKFYDLNTLKDWLTGIMAHDLRSPLCTLRSLFDLLSDKTISQEELLNMLPKVVMKLNYTSDVLDTILSWANSQIGNFESAVRDFSLYNIIISEANHIAQEASNKGITINYNIPFGLMAFADPNAVRIVVRNLIFNAIEFCKKNETINVRATHQDKFILVSVEESYVGTTSKEFNNIFKGEVDSNVGTEQEFATGIGLLFCKDLVEKSHGNIWVTSEIGTGRVFSFTIPAIPTPAIPN